MIFREYN